MLSCILFQTPSVYWLPRIEWTALTKYKLKPKSTSVAMGSCIVCLGEDGRPTGKAVGPHGYE